MTLMNYIKIVDPLILRVKKCEKVGREIRQSPDFVALRL